MQELHSAFLKRNHNLREWIFKTDEKHLFIMEEQSGGYTQGP